MDYIIEKPVNFKSARIVYDGVPKLVITLTDTLFQRQMDLEPTYSDFKLEITDTEIIVTEE